MSDWLNEITDQLESIATAVTHQDACFKSELSRADQAVNDLYHQIEAAPFGLIEGYHLARQLQEALVTRRQIKLHIATTSLLTFHLTRINRGAKRRLKEIDHSRALHSTEAIEEALQAEIAAHGKHERPAS
jgi:hypothetical protein